MQQATGGEKQIPRPSYPSTRNCGARGPGYKDPRVKTTCGAPEKPATQGFMVAGLGHRRSVEAVEQEIDDDAGDGDIEPDREGPAGDAAVTVEFLREGAGKRDQRERHDDDGQDSMRAEQREIDGADPSLAGERHDAGMQMVDHVRSEKDYRAGKSDEHANAMGSDAMAASLHIAGSEKNGARKLHDGVECGRGDHTGGA